jgi:multisubunit Na+/H+ antiporter MnhG subunit
LDWFTTLKNYKMSEIKERIFANWKTTTLGVAVLIAGLVLVYLEKASLAELTAFVSGALVLLISKDGK